VTDDGGKGRGSFVEPEIYYAGLAAAFVTAGALITDTGGRVLLVKPNYRDHWLFPGGTADDNESPEAACAREIKEDELDDHAFFEPGKAATLLGHVGDRLPAALRARAAGGLVYMSPS
jgi:hypothetical protein